LWGTSLRKQRNKIVIEKRTHEEDFTMKFSKTMIAIAMAASLTLVGCGSSSQNNTNGNTSTPAPAPAPAQDQTAAIKPGVEKMLTTTSDLKKAIDAGDEAKVKTTAPQLEDTWATFEDAVKPKYADNYGEIEQYLDPTIAGSKATPLDKAALGKLNDQLTDALNKLAQKVK
jgi:iron uptake system EfeUOB component EfeO/EfeM